MIKSKIKILSAVADKPGIQLSQLDCDEEYARELAEAGYIRCDMDDWPFSDLRISSKGEEALEESKVERLKETRNWISLGIAVAAFIKSFFF